MARESCRKAGKLTDSWHRCKACGKETGSKHTTEADSELALNGHLTSKSMHELRSFGPRSDDRIHPSPSMYLQLKATWKEEKHEQERRAGRHGDEAPRGSEDRAESPPKRKVEFGPKVPHGDPRGRWGKQRRSR